MKDYLNFIDYKYPIRRSEIQKEQFRNYVKEEVSLNGYNVEIEKLNKKHNNIIIGDINRAKVIFTAHYDTPAASLFPNLMMPRHPILTMVYQLIHSLIYVSIALIISFILGGVFDLEYTFIIVIYLYLYLFIFFLGNLTFTNKNNKNDNTSGVAGILTLIEKNKGNDQVAFVLFDNEEKGLLGSKAFAKKYNEIAHNKLVINLDCIGYGEHVIFVIKEKANLTSEYQQLIKDFTSNEKFNVSFYPKKGSIGNSDYKNFECGIGLMTCKKIPIIGYCTPRIHTSFDTIANVENIEFISNQLTIFINHLN